MKFSGVFVFIFVAVFLAMMNEQVSGCLFHRNGGGGGGLFGGGGGGGGRFKRSIEVPSQKEFGLEGLY